MVQCIMVTRKETAMTNFHLPSTHISMKYTSTVPYINLYGNILFILSGGVSGVGEGAWDLSIMHKGGARQKRLRTIGVNYKNQACFVYFQCAFCNNK